MALRELLAQFDVKFNGAAQLRQADTQVTQLASHMRQAATATDRLSAVQAKLRFAGQMRPVSPAVPQLTTGADIAAFDRAHAVVSRSPGIFSRAGIAMSGLWQRAAEGPGIVSALASNWHHLLGVLGSAYIFSHLVGHTLDEARALNKLSKQTGESVEELKKLEYQANLSGVSSDDLRMGIRRLYMDLGQASSGSKRMKGIFDAFGIETDKKKGLEPVSEMLVKVADGMSQISDPSEKAALSMQLFGRAGMQMIPLLSKSTEELRALAEDFELMANKHGVEKFYKNAAILTKEGKRTKFAMGELKEEIVAALLPGLIKSAKMTTEFVRGLQRLNSGGALVRLMFTGLAAVVITRMPAMISAVHHFAAAWGLPLVAVVLLGLALEDLYTYSKGGKSFLGDSFLPNAARTLLVVQDLVSRFVAKNIEDFQICSAVIQDIWINMMQGLRLPQFALKALGAEGPADNEERLRTKIDFNDARRRTNFLNDIDLIDRRQKGGPGLGSGQWHGKAKGAVGSQPGDEDLVNRAQAWARGRPDISERAYQGGEGVGRRIVEKNLTDKSTTTIHVNVTDKEAGKKVADQVAKLTRNARAALNAGGVEQIE